MLARSHLPKYTGLETPVPGRSLSSRRSSHTAPTIRDSRVASEGGGCGKHKQVRRGAPVLPQHLGGGYKQAVMWSPPARLSAARCFGSRPGIGQRPGRMKVAPRTVANRHRMFRRLLMSLRGYLDTFYCAGKYWADVSVQSHSVCSYGCLRNCVSFIHKLAYSNDTNG